MGNKKIAKYKSQLQIHQKHQGITKVLNILLHRSEMTKEKLLATQEKLTKSLTASIGKSKKFRMNIINLLTRKRKSNLEVGQKKFALAKKIHKQNHKDILLLQGKLEKLLGDQKNLPTKTKKSTQLAELRKVLNGERESYKASGIALN